MKAGNEKRQLIYVRVRTWPLSGFSAPDSVNRSEVRWCGTYSLADPRLSLTGEYPTLREQGANLVRRVYWKHNVDPEQFSESDEDIDALWRDAEEHLDHLDAA